MIKSIFKIILIFLVALGFVYISVLITKFLEKDTPKENKVIFIKPEIDTENIINGINSINDILNSYTNSNITKIYTEQVNTSKNLIKSCENPDGVGVISQEQCNREIGKITKIINLEGNPSNGWLYIKAGIFKKDGSVRPVNDEYETIWFFIDETNFSGHLSVEHSLINRITDDGYTELLFDLSEVVLFDLSEKNNIKNESKDLIEQLKKKNPHFIASFVSTLEQGVIAEFKIGLDSGKINIE